MRESEYLEIMQGIRPEQIAEATQWQSRKQKNTSVQNKQPLPPPPRTLGEFFEPAEAAPVRAENRRVTPTGSDKRLSLRGMGIAFGSVAAVLAVVVGIIIKNADLPIEAGYAPGSSDIFSEITVIGGETALTQPAGETVPPRQTFPGETVINCTTAETTAETTVTTTEITAVRPAVTAPPTGYTDTEPNMLGGEGAFRPAISNITCIPPVFEDNRYYYAYSRYGQALRVDKTTLEVERVCQDPNCSHKTQKCPDRSMERYQLFADGEYLYRTALEYGMRLHRIQPDGTFREFFNTENIEGMEDCTQIGYSRIMKLGSTGYYYLSGYGWNYDTYSGKTNIPVHEAKNFAVIFVPETGAIRSIPVSVCRDESGSHFTEIQDVCFDAARHTLFMLYVDYAADTGTQTISVAEYSIEDGGCFGTSAPIDSFDGENWTVRNGILYYLEHTETGTNYSAVNLDTGEKTVLCENCGWNELVFTGDPYTGYTLYILKRTEGENPETTLYYANTDGTGLAEYWHTDGKYTVYGANGGLVMLGKMEGRLISYGTGADSITTETDAIVSYVLLVGGEAVCLPDQTALRYE